MTYDASSKGQLNQRRFIPKHRGHKLLLHLCLHWDLLPTMMPISGFDRKSGNEATLWETRSVAPSLA